MSECLPGGGGGEGGRVALVPVVNGHVSRLAFPMAFGYCVSVAIRKVPVQSRGRSVVSFPACLAIDSSQFRSSSPGEGLPERL